MTTQRELRPFKSIFTVTDGDPAFDTAAEVGALVEAQTAATGFSLIWQRTIPAQQAVHWGYGNPALQSNQGHMAFFAIDNGTDFEEGIIRLVQANALQTKKITVAEFSSKNLHIQIAAPTPIIAQPNRLDEMMPLPEQIGFPLVGEDSLMQIEWRPTEAGTTVDFVDFQIPVTIYQ